MRNERGATIVEVMVGLMVLAVGVLPVIALMASGYRYQGQARLDIQMATLAESKVEELVAIAGTQLPDTVALSVGGSVTSDMAGHSDLVDLNGQTFVRRWRVELGPAGARDVTLRVTTQPSVGRAVEVSTQVVHD